MTDDASPSPAPASDRRANLLFVGAFVMEISGGIAITALPLLAIKFGASESQLGALAAAQRVPYIILCVLFGALSDRSGPKVLATLAACVLAGIYCNYPLATSVANLICLVPVTAVGVALFWPPVQAWVRELPTASMGKRATRFNMAWSLGSTIGFLIGGFIAERDERLPFWVCAGLMLVLLVLVRATPGGSKPSKRRAAAARGGAHIPTHPLNDAFLYASWVANFAAFGSMGVIFFILPKLLKELDYSNWFFGVLLFSNGLSRTFTFFLMGQTERWHYRLRHVIAAQCASALGMLLIAASRHWAVLLLGVAAAGHACGVCYGASLTYCLRSAGNVGRRAGLHESILIMGSVSGASVGGYCAQYYGAETPYLISAAALALAVAIQGAMIARARARRT